MPALPWQLDFTGTCATDGAMAWGFCLFRKDTGELEADCGAMGNGLGNCETVAAYIGLWYGLARIRKWHKWKTGQDYCGVMLRTDFAGIATALEEKWHEGVKVGERVKAAHRKCIEVLSGELAPFLIEHVPTGQLLLAAEKCREAMEGIKARKAG
jgi:hypothetical protein